jgi:hypothetical protein
MDVQDYKHFGFRADKKHKSKKPAKKIYSTNPLYPLLYSFIDFFYTLSLASLSSSHYLFTYFFSTATYLKQGAEREVNIPESLRAVIAERLNDPTITMFDEAQAEVLSLMRSDSFSVCEFSFSSSLFSFSSSFIFLFF